MERDDPAETIRAATRTLVASGYEITGCRRQATHVEIECERVLLVGARCRLLIAISYRDAFAEADLDAVRREAERNGRSLALVAQEPSAQNVSWSEFLEALGGEVPSWRALSAEYPYYLLEAAQNRVPAGCSGEAWLLFENLVGDGLAFLFARRVRWLGGRTRGKPVSDMLAYTPDLKLLLVDAKAAGAGFDASLPELRPLGEYVRRQQTRQHGHAPLYGAVVVSSKFKQAAQDLAKIHSGFFAEYQVPVSFLEAAALGLLVQCLRDQVPLRNAIRWGHLFSGRLLTSAVVETEVRDAARERLLPEES